MRALALALTLLLSFGLALAEEFDTGNALFRVSESHTRELKQDTIRTVDTVRFGSFTLALTQNIDAKTGLARKSWGDMDIRTYGRASWWFPPTFAVTVRLEGDQKDLLVAAPTYMGLLECFTLREVANERVVAEADWRDELGGALRMRFVSWRGEPEQFGIIARYFPPEGRTVSVFACTTCCNPLQYVTDATVRKRWIKTAKRFEEVPKPPAAELDPTKEWAMVFLNRFAMQNGGGSLAVNPEAIAGISLSQNWAGTVETRVTAKDPTGDLCLLVGDWSGKNGLIYADNYLGAPETLRASLARLEGLKLPRPAAPPAAEEAQIEALLADYPPLEAQFGAQVRANREELTASLAAFGDLPGDFVRWYRASQKRTELITAMKKAWFDNKLWAR